MKLRSVLVITSLFLVFSSCNKAESKTQTEVSTQSLSQDEISVMTYNVENLFDTKHDEGTNDYTYLPLAVKKNNHDVFDFCDGMSNENFKEECLTLDWNDDVVDAKLTNLATVIRTANDNKGADVLILQEVENEAILKLLFDVKLKDLGYKSIVISKGPDTRGINVAVVSKFNISSSQTHLIPFKLSNPKDIAAAKKTRGIIEAVIDLPNGKQLTMMSAHFPSQSNPTIMRKQAMQFMADTMNAYAQAGRAVIAGGDLNTTKEENEIHKYFETILTTAGDVSHFVGCKSCPGTEYYKPTNTWNFFDIMTFGKALKDNGLELVKESIQIITVPGVNLKTNDNTPLRFFAHNKQGSSDHLPLFAKLKLTTVSK